MPSYPFEEQGYQALLKLAIARVGGLNDAERNVLRLSALKSPTEDSTQPPEVRAQFLRWLATDRDAAAHIDPLGIRVFGADVVHTLELNYCKMPFPLRFDRCELKGEVNLRYAELPFLSFEHCNLDSGLDADGVRIAGDFGLSSSTVKGTVSLIGAQIGGDLACEETTLEGEDGESGDKGEALVADGLDARNVYLRNGFSAKGNVSLVGAEISGDFDCSDADQFLGLYCDQMRVGSGMSYTAIAHPETAKLVLYEASVGSFHDDERSWPQKGNLGLDGFVYQELVAHKPASTFEMGVDETGDRAGLDVASRIRWLRLQPDGELDRAQPWMQLAKFLEAMGDTRGAKHVIYEYHRQRVSRSWFWRGRTFVYDYIKEDPLRVGWFIGGFWAIGALVFWRAQRMHAMRSKDGASQGAAPGVSCDPVPFSPSVYALENVLPVVKLGQDGAWEPDPASQGTLLPDGWIFARLNRVAEKWRFTRWLLKLDYDRLAAVRWLLILAGWVLALILAAAIGGEFKQ